MNFSAGIVSFFPTALKRTLAFSVDDNNLDEDWLYRKRTDGSFKTGCFLFFAAAWLETANIRLVCCVIWLVATVWSSFPLFGWGEYAPEPYGLSCTIAWRGYHTSAKDAFYVICSFVCFTLLPVLIIVMSHCQILYKVSRFSYSLSAQGIQNNLRRAEKRLSMVSPLCCFMAPVLERKSYSTQANKNPEIIMFQFICKSTNVKCLGPFNQTHHRNTGLCSVV